MDGAGASESFQSSAAVWWLSTARSPARSTAAHNRADAEWAAEPDEYTPVKPLPSPRINARRDRMPRQSRPDSLLAREDALLPVEKIYCR